MVSEIRDSLDNGRFAAYKKAKLAGMGMEEGQRGVSEKEKRGGKNAPQEENA